jgi:hypothetical protein
MLFQKEFAMSDSNNRSLDGLPEAERDLTAQLIGEYYDWTIGKGGTSSEVILSRTDLSQGQRKFILERMDDINVIGGIMNSIKGRKG